MNYSVNRFNMELAEDLENRVFGNKRDAVKFAKGARYYSVRKITKASRALVLSNTGAKE